MSIAAKDGISLDRQALPIFEEIVEQDVADWRALVAKRCGEDRALTQRVLALLDRAAVEDGMLQTGGIAAWLEHDDEPLPERVGPYRITGLLGRGGMGVVARGERDDGVFEQDVAIKLMRGSLTSAEALGRFLAERRILGRLIAPGIARILDGGAINGTPWLAMDLVEGRSITGHAKAEALGLDARLALFAQVCEAVAFAHRQLVIHADIKPSNILVDAGATVKLVDFGIARLIGEDGVSVEQSAGALTRQYASPERLAGQPPGVAGDVYSLGMVLRELVEGQTVDADLSAIMDKATAEDPVDRYPDVPALVADLNARARHQPVNARDAPMLERGMKFVRRHRLAAAIGVLLIGTTAISSFQYVQAERARDQAEARFAETRNLSNFLVSDVVTRLETMPNTGPIRQQIAERARSALEKLGEVPDAPLELQVETAKAYAAIGNIMTAQDLSATLDQGAGDAVLARAEAILRPLVGQLPHRVDLRVSLAETLSSRAWYTGRATVSPQQTFAKLDEIETILQPVLAKDPANYRARMVRIWSLLLRGGTEFAEKNFDRSMLSYNKAWEDIEATKPETVRERADLALVRAMAGSRIGDYHYYGKEDAAQALIWYKRGKAAFDDPAIAEDVRIIKQRTYTIFDVASTLYELGDKSGSIAMTEAGLTDIENLRRLDKSASTIRVENILREDYSYQLQHAGRVPEAWAQNERAIAGIRTYVKMLPNNYGAERQLPVSLLPAGELYRDTGNRGKACAYFREADALWSKLARENRVTERDRDNDVKRVKEEVAKCG